MTVQASPPQPRAFDAPPLLSFVVPVFNEQDAVAAFLQALAPVMAQLPVRCELVFVNDGSRDATLERLLALAAADERVRVVDLSRNFGKEAALTAGLDHAAGEAVVVMDVDLQDPPELVPTMVERWLAGYDVVLGKRVRRANDTPMKRASAGAFYRTYNRVSTVSIPENVGDFRLMDRRVVQALAALPERIRFMKGLFAWVGFPSTEVEYERPPRERGETKFNYWKLWNFALDGVTSFSTMPLRVWTYVGVAIALFAFAYAAVIVAKTLFLGTDVPGYASTLTSVLFLGGIQLIGLGVIGEYLGRVYVEVKQRPVYLVNRRYGFHGDAGAREAR